MIIKIAEMSFFCITTVVLNWITIIIGALGIIITVVSSIITVKSMNQTEKYKKDAEKYKNQAFEQLKCIDLYSYAESFSIAASEITRYNAKENNNRAGKLSSLFDMLSKVLSEMSKYTSVFEETDSVKQLKQYRKQINEFIITNRANPTVDLNELSKLFTETDELLRSEILNYQKNMKQQ